jgi:hypothetical protein
MELREDRIAEWSAENADWLQQPLDDGFVARLAAVFQTLPPLGVAGRDWASRYLPQPLAEVVHAARTNGASCDMYCRLFPDCWLCQQWTEHSPVMPSGADPAASGAALLDVEHVSTYGAYQTGFEIPGPPAPAAPGVALSYNSQTNSSIAGIGWDLSVGYPMSILRDVRYGTPTWTFDANWLWGSSPLVPLDPTSQDCALRKCRYRVAPDSLTEVTIDLSVVPGSGPRA